MAWDPTLKARPTVHRGVQMRSRLEAGFAAWLDGAGIRWDYEPCAFSSGAGQYLPDFRLHDVPILGYPDGTPIYVEVKPTLDGLTAAPQLRVIWKSEPRAVLLIATPPDDGDLGAPSAFIQARIVLPVSLGAPATCVALWCKSTPVDGDERLGLAVPYDAVGGPWAGKWWQVAS